MMKKSVLLSVMAAVVLVLSGCQKDKPYSLYQIASTFPDVDLTIKEDDMTQQQLANFRVATFVADWLVDNGYIYSGNLNNPITFEGGDEEYNDEQAIIYFENKHNELKKAYEDGKIDEALAKAVEEGKVTVPVPVDTRFTYALYKGSTAGLVPGYIRTFGITYPNNTVNPED